MNNEAYRELSLICARYSRVIVVRVDLHPSPDGIHPHTIDTTRFRKSIVRKLNRKFRSKVAYQWVNEFGKKEYNEGSHWHWWFAIRSDDSMQPHTQAKEMGDLIISTWKEKVGGPCERNNKAGWFYLRRQDFTMEKRLSDQNQIANGTRMDKNDVFFPRSIISKRTIHNNSVVGGVVDECFFALSYMAKVNSKKRPVEASGRPLFKASKLNTKDKRNDRQQEIESNLEIINTNLKTALEPVPLSDENIAAYNKYIDEEEKEKELDRSLEEIDRLRDSGEINEEEHRRREGELFSRLGQ